MIEGNPHILPDAAYAMALDIADRAKERNNSLSGIVPPKEHLDFLSGKDQLKGASYDGEETLLEAHVPPFTSTDSPVFHPGRILAALRDLFWAPTSEEMHTD